MADNCPRITFSNVDFPQPFGPVSATRIGPSMRKFSGGMVIKGSSNCSSTNTCLPATTALPGRVSITGQSSSTR
ncbi:hypothetical protein D3C77_766750 [compost metagenome]